MTDTNITLTPTTADVSGIQTVTASAALFVAGDVGRTLALFLLAPLRLASQAYGVGVIFYSSFAGVDRVYRVVKDGTTPAATAAGTTPNYDLNAPREAGAGLQDGTCTLLYLGQGRHVWGFGTITTVTDSTHVQVNVDPKGPFASVSATLRWKMGEFSALRGYPRDGIFHKQRLWLGGTTIKPNTLWSSETGQFYSYSSSEPDGTVLDTNAITESLDDDQLNTILWLSSLRRGLVIGVASGEWSVTPAGNTAGVSPSNTKADRETDCGSDVNMPGLRVSGCVLFFEAGGKKLWQLEYDAISDSFKPTDLTLLSDHITGPGIVDVAYQKRPNGTLWMVRSDGVLVTLTFDREQKVRAWTRHLLGGVQGAEAESVCVVPAPDGISDDVYVSVKRTLTPSVYNGATIRTIEFIRAPFKASLEGAENGFFVDAGLTYDGAPHHTFSGLEHLEGETVWICADGSVRQNQLVTGGAVTITGPAASVVHIGLPYAVWITTLPPEAGAGAVQGTAQGKMQRIHEVTLRLLESGGGLLGRIGGQFDPIVTRTVDDPIGAAVPLFTGDKRMPFPEGSDRHGQLTVYQAAPLPFTLLAIIQERNLSG